ncbi:T9SS type A sorting domain-containing protein [bacterium]|nr:T9SS type A sorting domain-containing protein [bacterium]
MSGFRIIHGGGSTRLTSGGIRCEYSSPTLDDLVITDSEVSYYGGIGAIYSSLLLTNSIIESNTVLSSGGALGLTWPGSAEIRDCVFSNTAGGGYGGGAVVHNTAAYFENVHFVGNSAGVAGGALQCEDSAITLTHCYFINNEARDGGAIAMRGTTLTLQDCTFIGNYATRWGGALYYDELGDPSGGLVENCDFKGNRANAGSAILVHELGSPTLRGLTIVGNFGTAIDCLYGTVVSIENCLIANNYLAYGISIVDTDGVSVSCCDVWGNEGGNYGGMLEDQTGLNGNISEDPLLCDPNYDTLGVAEDSPCLPPNNACGVLMGNHGAECTLTAVGAPAPPGVTLEANYPNPFNPSTTIPFSLASASAITLSIHDLSGRLVCFLSAQRHVPAGRHELRWDGRNSAGQPAPSGVYFYRLETAQGATARPMLLVK